MSRTWKITTAVVLGLEAVILVISLVALQSTEAPIARSNANFRVVDGTVVFVQAGVPYTVTDGIVSMPVGEAWVNDLLASGRIEFLGAAGNNVYGSDALVIGGSFTVNPGGIFEIQSGATVTMATVSLSDSLSVESGSVLSILSGGILEAKSGSTVLLNSAIITTGLAAADLNVTNDADIQGALFADSAVITTGLSADSVSAAIITGTTEISTAKLSLGASSTILEWTFGIETTPANDAIVAHGQSMTPTACFLQNVGANITRSLTITGTNATSFWIGVGEGDAGDVYWQCIR